MKFRKKPIVIEAEQFFPDRLPWPEGVLGGETLAGEKAPHYVRTLEGNHVASPGDWIITGIKGEKYPCKPDIFEATYEPVSSTIPGEREVVTADGLLTLAEEAVRTVTDAFAWKMQYRGVALEFAEVERITIQRIFEALHSLRGRFSLASRSGRVAIAALFDLLDQLHAEAEAIRDSATAP